MSEVYVIQHQTPSKNTITFKGHYKDKIIYEHIELNRAPCMYELFAVCLKNA